MTETADPGLAQEVAAAFAWWREAGVDCAFRDDPVDWIMPPASADPAEKLPAPRPARSPAAPEPVAAPAFDLASLPQDIEGFCAWWQAEPWLDEGRVSGRVPPRGKAGAELMVVVPEPEREDAGRLLSGPQGRLLDAMLAAMGMAPEQVPEQVYVASALCRHTPMADWTNAAARGLGEVLRHHVALVAPKRLIVFGSNTLPLLGHDLPNKGLFSFQLNHGDISIPLMPATDLGALLARPRAKAKVWQQWLAWN